MNCHTVPIDTLQKKRIHFFRTGVTVSESDMQNRIREITTSFPQLVFEKKEWLLVMPMLTGGRIDMLSALRKLVGSLINGLMLDIGNLLPISPKMSKSE